MDTRHRTAKWTAAVHFFPVLLLVAGACGESTNELTAPVPPALSVISVADNLAKLAAVAEDWRPDAYLVSVRVPVTALAGLTEVLSAEFQAPASDEFSLLVTLFENGRCEREALFHPRGVNRDQRISPADWSLDSPEALQLLLQEAARHDLGAPLDELCSTLWLERSFAIRNDPVVWRLSLSNCQTARDTVLIRIDASNGEVYSPQ